MIRALRCAAALASAAPITACSAVGAPPRAFVAPGVDFGAYETFAIVAPRHAAGDRNVRRVERALRFELLDRGLLETDRSAADLEITFDVVARGKTRVSNWDPDTGLRDELRTQEIATTLYARGTLVVAAWDPAREAEVWRSAAGTDSFGLGSSEDATRRLAIEVLDTFPAGLVPRTAEEPSEPRGGD